MFFKSDQANVSDARDAVKKQLLRTLIQQVVDELNSESGEGFDEAIAEFLSNENLAPAAGAIKSALSAGIRQHLFPDLVKEVMQELAPDTDDLDELVVRHLEEIDFSLVREQFRAGFKRQLQEKIIPASIIDAVDEATIDASGDVQRMVEEAMQQVDVTELSSTVRGEVQRRVHALIPDVVRQEVSDSVDTHEPEMIERISDAVAAADADAMIGRLRALAAEAFESRLEQEIRDELTSPTKSMHDHLEALVSRRFEDFLVSSDWADGLRAAEASVLDQVRQAIEETVTGEDLLQERLNEAIEERIASNDALRSQLEKNARQALVASLADQLSVNLAESAQLVEETAQSITSQASIVSQLEPKVRTRVMEFVATLAVEQLADADAAAEESLHHVDMDAAPIQAAVASLTAELVRQIAGRTTDSMQDAVQIAERASAQVDHDHANLLAAREALVDRLVAEVAENGLAAMAASDEAAQNARAWVQADHPTIREAVSSVLDHVISTVRSQAQKEAADTHTVVGNVLPSFTAETDVIKSSIRETRNRLIERVAQFTVREMEDASRVAAEASKRVADENERMLSAVQATLGTLTERVAEGALDRLHASDEVAAEASSRVPTDNEVFQRAIKATMSLLIDDIVLEVGSRMRSPEKVSSDARNRMAETPSEVRQAAGVLENMLLQQVAEMAKERLYDVQHASEKASTFLRATKELDAIEEAMRMKLFKGLADQVVKSIEDPETTGAEAFWHIDQQHDHILDATSELRNQLLFTIAQETMKQIANGEETAREARTLIPATSKQITEATRRLHRMLIEEVARESMNLMRDTDEVIREARETVGDDHEVVQQMRGVVERHLMESLLESALTDIGQSITGIDEPGEKTYFRQAVRGIQANRSAHSETQPSASAENAPAVRSEPAPAPQPAPTAPEATSAASQIEPVLDATIWAEESEVDTDEPQAETKEDFSSEAAEAWSSLEDLSSDRQTVRSRAWKVNEFRPEDRGAVPGAVSGDGTRSRAPKFPTPGSRSLTLYVFGIVRAEQADPEALAGIEGITSESDIKLLSCGNLTALVSPVQDVRFRPDAMKQSMSDADWLKEHVRRHADVLAEAQSVQTVIPMRFGCVFSNPAEVKAFVEQREATFAEALDRLHNRSEFSVRVRFEGSAADSELEGVPAGVADFLRQAARDVDHSPRPDGIADRIHSHLSRFAGEAVRITPLESDLMLHATYLVTVASENEFREEVRKLSGEFHALGIQIEVSGPWPPYHFVDMDYDDLEGGAAAEA